MSRGRLLNRFGKDLEGIDSSLSGNFGRSVTHAMSVATTLVTLLVVAGWQFAIAAVVGGVMFFRGKHSFSL